MWPSPHQLFNHKSFCLCGYPGTGRALWGWLSSHQHSRALTAHLCRPGGREKPQQLLGVAMTLIAAKSVTWVPAEGRSRLLQPGLDGRRGGTRRDVGYGSYSAGGRLLEASEGRRSF